MACSEPNICGISPSLSFLPIIKILGKPLLSGEHASWEQQRKSRLVKYVAWTALVSFHPTRLINLSHLYLSSQLDFQLEKIPFLPINWFSFAFLGGRQIAAFLCQAWQWHISAYNSRYLQSNDRWFCWPQSIGNNLCFRCQQHSLLVHFDRAVTNVNKHPSIQNKCKVSRWRGVSM